MKPQAIAGVSAGLDREIETVYPSIASTGVGRAIGAICDSIPVRIGGIKLSALLFALPLAPIAVIPYALQKLFGRRYVLTNRALRITSALGGRLFREIGLGEFENIGIEARTGQSFYHAGDLVLLKANGDAVETLPGVPRPERFRQVLLDARDARLTSDAALATVSARQPQSA